MKKIFQFLFSIPVAGFLLLLLVFSMALATFIETSLGTEVAKNLIYNAHWFEFLMFFLGASLVINFVRNMLYQWGKLSVGIFHLAFVIILIGAAITRYFSFEGVMHIREGKSSATIISSDSYLTIHTPDREIKKKVLFSTFSKKAYDEKIILNGQSVRIKSIDFVKSARRTVVEHSNGSPYIDIVISGDNGKENFVFSNGEKIELGDASVGFCDDTDISLIQEGDSLYIKSAIDLEKRSMIANDSELIPAGTKVKVQERSLYSFNNYFLLIKKFYPRALIRVAHDISGSTAEDAVVLEVSDGQQTRLINVFGTNEVVSDPVKCTIEGTEIEFSYGSVVIDLPFELYLRDFQLEKYVGSKSPSSFTSELTLTDKKLGIERNVRVFMNNTLKYRGYRFYQSSYDQDEKGTVLMVNKDFWGTLVTYIGYFLMTLGIILSLLSRKSYFQHLIRYLKKLNRIKAAGIVILFLSMGYNACGNDSTNNVIPSLYPQLVKDFSELWVQGKDGRIKPMSTLSGEILRKVSRKSSLDGMSPDEVVLSMNLYPELWQYVKMIKVDKQVAASLGSQGNYASVLDFFNENGQYIIKDEVQTAYNKSPTQRNQLEKNYLYADERLNVCFMVYRGKYFTFFPSQNPADEWYTAGDTLYRYSSSDSLFVNRSFKLLKESLKNDSEGLPLQIISSIAEFQKKYGADILPSQAKKRLEIISNKVQPFRRIFPWYMTLGFVLLVMLFVNIFRQETNNIIYTHVITILIVLSFIFHSVGLIFRWYISDHAPWSNGYESMVYISWVAALSGIIFGRKYKMVLGTAAFLSGLTLFVADLSWMNPEITNLVPVLKSHWLIFHVAVITASYGFIGLSAFLGLLVMVLYVFMRNFNRNSINSIIVQLTTISELSATLGLYMLVIGTFLGGVWANESWGRYWGWDPKETWALITILIYAFVVHMRFIPSLRGTFIFNLATICGFSSVLMTYFGVNYLLRGKHSYGKGSIEGILWPVFFTALFVIVLITIAYLNHKKIETGKTEDE